MKKITIGLILLATVLFNFTGCINNENAVDTGSGTGTEEINGAKRTVKSLYYPEPEIKSVWLIFSSENIISLDKEPATYTSIEIPLSRMGEAQNIIDNENIDLQIRCNGKYYDLREGGFKSGTLNVTQSGKIYTVTLTAILDDDTLYKLNYSGEPGEITDDPRDNSSSDEDNYLAVNGVNKDIISTAIFSTSSNLWLVLVPYPVSDYYSMPTEYASIEISPSMYDKDLDFSTSGIFFEYYTANTTYNVSNKNIKNGRIYFNKENNVYTFRFNVDTNDGRNLFGQYRGRPKYVYSTDPRISKVSSATGNNEGTTEIQW
jgi:hypothetical protein